MHRIKKFLNDHRELIIATAVGTSIVAAYQVGVNRGLSGNRIAKAEKYSNTDGRQCIELTFRNGARQDIIWKDSDHV